VSTVLKLSPAHVASCSEAFKVAFFSIKSIKVGELLSDPLVGILELIFLEQVGSALTLCIFLDRPGKGEANCLFKQQIITSGFLSYHS
jgi:hypothetical protein